MDKRRGFTLIELLVVIAIIALLMSILMPALTGKEAGKNNRLFSESETMGPYVCDVLRR